MKPARGQPAFTELPAQRTEHHADQRAPGEQACIVRDQRRHAPREQGKEQQCARGIFLGAACHSLANFYRSCARIRRMAISDTRAGSGLATPLAGELRVFPWIHSKE